LSNGSDGTKLWNAIFYYRKGTTQRFCSNVSATATPEDLLGRYKGVAGIYAIVHYSGIETVPKTARPQLLVSFHHTFGTKKNPEHSLQHTFDQLLEY
jgi:hypothetical protein